MTFAEVARRERAECTTTITTTREERYVHASDYADMKARAERAEADRDRLRAALQALYNVEQFGQEGWTSPELRAIAIKQAKEALASYGPEEDLYKPYPVEREKGEALAGEQGGRR
jgi:hypothetical protein